MYSIGHGFDKEVGWALLRPHSFTWACIVAMAMGSLSYLTRILQNQTFTPVKHNIIWSHLTTCGQISLEKTVKMQLQLRFYSSPGRKSFSWLEIEWVNSVRIEFIMLHSKMLVLHFYTQFLSKLTHWIYYFCSRNYNIIFQIQHHKSNLSVLYH
jgi:hypothetical protein